MMIELIESVIQFVELYIADDNHHGKNKKIPEKTPGFISIVKQKHIIGPLPLLSSFLGQLRYKLSRVRGKE